MMSGELLTQVQLKAGLSEDKMWGLFEVICNGELGKPAGVRHRISLPGQGGTFL